MSENGGGGGRSRTHFSLVVVAACVERLKLFWKWMAPKDPGS